MRAWVDAGVVASWDGRLVAIDGGDITPKTGDVSRYVGTPDMNSLAAHLAEDLTVKTGSRVARVEETGDKFALFGTVYPTEDVQPLGEGFDAVVINTPRPQVMDLFAGSNLTKTPVVPDVAPEACWTLVATYQSPVEVPFDGAFVNNDPVLSWVARNSSKPGRGPQNGERSTAGGTDCWVLHGSPRWSEANLETPRDEVEGLMLQAAAGALGHAGFAKPETVFLHRWKYAQGRPNVRQRPLPGTTAVWLFAGIG